ncbi:hypothetical protein BDW75DRAFT_174846 [Aspergillus navahoensis]
MKRLADDTSFQRHRSPLSTSSSVSVVVSSSPRSRLSLPSTTATRASVASAMLVSLPVPPTAVRGSAVTPTSCAPRRSSNKRLVHVYVFFCVAGAEGCDCAVGNCNAKKVPFLTSGVGMLKKHQKSWSRYILYGYSRNQLQSIKQL